MSIVLLGSTSGSCTLQEQAIAGTTTLTLPTVSGTLITTASSGQSIPRAALPAGAVLQVVNGTVGYVTTTSASYVDTGLTATITPTSSSSKVLVLVNLNMISTTAVSQAILFRLANASGTPLQVMIDYNYTTIQTGTLFSSLSYLHSPATTSAYTYKVQYASNGTNTLRLNDYSSSAALSTITLMEIAA